MLNTMKKDKNYLEDLAEYVSKNLKKGYTTESLKWALVKQGHSKLEVDKAIKLVEQQMASKAPVLEVKPEIKYEVEPVVEEKKSFWKKLFG